MKPIVCLLASCVLCSAAFASDYQVEKGSTLGFSSTFQGERFNGSFTRFEAQIRYDAANIEASKFDVSIDLASASTGDKDRDDTLPGSEFFNVAKFPNAHFVTRQFKRNGEQVIAEGTLTLKGIDKPVDLQVTFVPKEGGATLDVSTVLKRLDFDVGSGEYADTSTIGNEVEVKAHLELGAKP